MHLAPLLRRALPLLVGLVAACGTEPPIGGPLPPPPPPPHPTIQRLIWASENKKNLEYESLFTRDFIFEFSLAADPTLAQKYAAGWFKTDEVTSARHLFQGFSDQAGYHPPAAIIELVFASTTAVGDTVGHDSTKYKTLATRVDLKVTVWPEPPATDTVRYLAENNFHRFFLVRGDAAHLDPWQIADSTHWYIWRWRDETVPTSSPSPDAPQPPAPVTWGWVKALYR